MPWGAAAAAAGAVVSGSMAADAAKDAAKTGADASDRASAQVQAAADQARRDVNAYIPAAQRDLLSGYSGAADIFSAGLPEQQRLLSGGNMNAQQTVGGGYNQYQSALMGMPVDQSNWQPRQVAPSEPIANPFTLGGQAGGPSNNMFTDISQVTQQQQQNQLEGLRTSRDFISAIERGELGAQGIDTGWFNKLMKENPTWGNSTEVLDRSRLTPQQINSQMGNWGLTQGNQQTYANLLSEIQRLRG